MGLIPPQQTLNQEIKISCLEVKPLTRSDRHTSCPQHQMCFSIFPVNHGSFGASQGVPVHGCYLRCCPVASWAAGGAKAAEEVVVGLRECCLT